MTVLDLDEPPQRDTLEVLLRLLENKICTGDRPALRYAGEWDGATGGESHVVCCADGEVGEEEEVANRVCTELQITYGNTVRGCAAERLEVDGFYVDGRTKSVEFFLGLRV